MLADASVPDVLQALATGVVPPGAVYIRLQTPVGVATVDPFAAAQDPTTQSVMQALGITLELGVGTPPPAPPGAGDLGANLKTVGLVLGGLLLLRALAGRRA